MPRYIAKFTDKETKTDYYLEWSTIVDAPVTYGVSLDEFKEYYKTQYGSHGFKDLDERLERVEAKGTSSQIDENINDLIEGNRAGVDEEELTYDEIVREYCTNIVSR
jgi:hypothetical protein